MGLGCQYTAAPGRYPFDLPDDLLPIEIRVTRIRSALSILAIFACLSCAPRETLVLDSALPDRNVVVVVIDSLRADHLGAYGYSRPTSPFIDRIAAQGWVFDSAFSHSSFTQQSIASLMSGLFPSRTGSTEWGVPPVESQETLGHFYAEAGFKTAFFSNTPVLKDRLFSQGFEVAEILADRWDLSGGGSKLVKRALDYAEDQRDDRFLMYLHFLDPHAPYDPSRKHHLRFTNEIYESPLHIYPEVRDRCHELVADGFGPGDPRFEDLVLRYDAEISVVDDAIRELFDGLDRVGALDDTVVVITSDHGEEFLDHQFVEHAWTLYDESLRVPLILWTSGIRAQRSDAQVGLVDVLPTLLQLSEIPFNPDRFDGRSLLRPKGAGFEPDDERREHLAEVLIQRRNVLRSWRIGPWKYIAAWRWLPPEDRPAALAAEQVPETDIWNDPVHEELYDLRADPSETRNLAAEHPERVEQFRAQMKKYLASCSQEKGRAPTPLTPEEESALKSLGYL